MTELRVHKLERNAYNFIHGTFGREQGRSEQICVQSVDGALYFINDEHILFKIQLADYLVPGPMLYAQDIDSVVIANSNMEIECYNYHSMKAFTNNDLERQKESQAKEELKSKIDPTWTTNIGEQARQMRFHSNRYSRQNDIVVLGEQTLFVLVEHGGGIRFQKRYSFTPSCFIAYNLQRPGADLYVPPDQTPDQVLANAGTNRFGGLATPGFMSLIASFEGYLMVYKDIKLAWTTKM